MSNKTEVIWYYPRIFLCGGCDSHHLALAFKLYQLEYCKKLLQEQKNKIAHDILGLMDMDDDDIPDGDTSFGFFHCEKCHSSHIGFSIEQYQFQYIRTKAKGFGRCLHDK